MSRVVLGELSYNEKFENSFNFNNLIVEFSKSKLAKSFKFCFGIPVDSIHIIAGKIGENLEKMSDEPQTLVTLQSCEDHHNMCKGHISKV